MYFTILILEAECIVNGTRVAVNRDKTVENFLSQNLAAYVFGRYKLQFIFFCDTYKLF